MTKKVNLTTANTTNANGLPADVNLAGGAATGAVINTATGGAGAAALNNTATDGTHPDAINQTATGGAATGALNNTATGGADAGAVSAAMAARIRLYRSQKKMSLDELSRRAGVSKGMLVEIEGCRANPSIALLCRIAAAMGVSVADFVNVASAPPVHVIAAEEIPVLWQGEHGGSARLLAGTSGPEMVELWRWVMQPGESFASPGHPQSTCELLYVEQGSLTLWVDEQRYEIAAGNSAVARTDAPHRYTNHGDSRLEFTMTVYEPGR